MKKIVLLFLLLAIGIIAFSQEITVRFTGQLNGTSYCRLDSVKVTNLTRNWTETVEYPDTIIVLGYYATNVTDLNVAATQGLGQNIPNPFDCETRVELSVSQRENVRMQLLDASGKQYAEYSGSLDAGVHTFDISAAAPQTYVLNATVGSRSYSIRMVNMGSGCGSSIKYAGVSGSIMAKLTTANEFQNGDNMRYVGYTTIGGQVVASDVKEQAQVVSQYVTLNFTHYSRPVVESLAATGITTTSATLHGNITDDGGAAVTSRGFYYGTDADNLSQILSAGSGNGEYSKALSGLSVATTYYYCAFATNSAGTAIGEVMSFTSLDIVPPTVQTNEGTNITFTEATLNGNVISDGNSAVTDRGFMYGTNVSNLTQTIQSGSGTGSFNEALTGLTLGTTYYYKAYATNSRGTSYGEAMQFTTLEPTIPTVVTYDATDITTTAATISGNITSDGGSTITAKGFQYGTSADNLANTVTLGIGAGAISTTLTSLDDNTTYFYRAYASNTIGTAYGETKAFTTAEIFAPSITTLPATDNTRTSLTLNASIASDGGAAITARGFYWGTAENDLPNYLASEQTTADFSATISDLASNTIYYFCAAATNIRGTTRGEVLSSRTNPLTAPTVVTNTATNITTETAMLNGAITDDGGTTVTARGFYWGTSEDNLVNNAVYDGTANNFSVNLTGLASNSTYYYCAYATNSTSTAIGEVMSLTTDCYCGGSSKVTDIDGNQYGTLLIGEQCWMAENLRATKFADGTSISLGSGTSSTTAYRYYPNNSSSNVATYGYLYNWPAAMHGASSSSTNPSNVQGVCPTGWHLPSDAEWTQLTDYLSSQSEYQCGGSTTNIAKSLASTTGWNSSTYTCAPGNTPANNNSTGFGALPAGWDSSSYQNFGNSAYFWSATEYSSSYAYYFTLYYGSASVGSSRSNDKNRGMSVRCVRD